MLDCQVLPFSKGRLAVKLKCTVKNECTVSLMFYAAGRNLVSAKIGLGHFWGLFPQSSICLLCQNAIS